MMRKGNFDYTGPQKHLEDRKPLQFEADNKLQKTGEFNDLGSPPKLPGESPNSDDHIY